MRLGRLKKMKNRGDITTRIRQFMELNEIEILPDFASIENEPEALKNGLAALQYLRADTLRVALQGTRGERGRRIARNVEKYKILYNTSVKWINRRYNEAVREFQLQEEAEAQQRAAKRKSIISRLKKLKSGHKSDCHAALDELAKQRDARLAKVNDAMDLMQKHCVLINLAQDRTAWDSTNLFLRNGAVQGKLWTHGFKAEDFTKLANGMWSVQMKWRAVPKSEWRPHTVYVDRRFGRYDKTKIEWVKMKPARLVSGPGDLEFTVDIRVRDDLFYEEP